LPLVRCGGLWQNKTVMGRWFRFLIAIMVGFAAGLFYGWEISPVEYVDTSPDTLSIDYKTDYVLMAAEAYQVEKDPEMAVQRLAVLGGDPIEMVVQAILSAERNGYIDSDLVLMRELSEALQTWQLEARQDP
jgi:hypothetical protein